MRLAFAVAAHFGAADLAGGRGLLSVTWRFRKNALARWVRWPAPDCTIVFVSHQMNQIRRLCEKVMWMDRRTIRLAGSNK